MIEKLQQVYVEEAVNNGGKGVAIQAIERYFQDINEQIRWVQKARLAAETSHIDATMEFAERAYRRPLAATERTELAAFYRQLRDQEGLNHEEAIQDMIVSVLMSPHFCYRVDMSISNDGRRRGMFGE